MPTVHLARHHTPADVRARLHDGTWLKVRRGAYVERPTTTDARTVEALLARACLAALHRQLSTQFVFSHVSAATLWGLPDGDRPARAHVTQPARTHGADPDVVSHVRPLRPDERAVAAGLPVTSLERTLVDCAATLPPRWALVLADAGLRAGARRGAWEEICERLAGSRGIGAARAVLALADDGAESPGESSARFVLIRAGLPVPETQIEVATHLGTFWSDLGWREWRLLAEYDGRGKYTASRSGIDTVLAEKRRHDAIQEAGWRVLRLTSADLRDTATLVGRVLRLAPPGAVRTLHPRVELASRGSRVRA